jgi:hypothetical protein
MGVHKHNTCNNNLRFDILTVLTMTVLSSGMSGLVVWQKFASISEEHK